MYIATIEVRSTKARRSGGAVSHRHGLPTTRTATRRSPLIHSQESGPLGSEERVEPQPSQAVVLEAPAKRNTNATLNEDRIRGTTASMPETSFICSLNTETDEKTSLQTNKLESEEESGLRRERTLKDFEEGHGTTT